MNENNNGNNVNAMGLNNNQDMYQQTQTNQIPNQFVMTDDGNFAPMPAYNEVPQVQPEMPAYNEVPQVQPEMPAYNEVPQVQPEIPVYNEVPQVQPEMPAYNEAPQMQPDMNAVPVLDIEEDEVVQTPSDVFGVNVPEEQIQQAQPIPGIPMQQVEEEKPKYGYASNEKADLNADENANIKFIIFLAIIMLIFIFLLPYLSDLM